MKQELEDCIAKREFWAGKTVLVPGGAVGGALAGALVAGPIGAAAGAIIGLIGGALTSEPLTEWATSAKRFKKYCIHLSVDHQNYPSPADVRKNYRWLMKTVHPDNNRDAPELVAIKFKEEALEH